MQIAISQIEPFSNDITKSALEAAYSALCSRHSALDTEATNHAQNLLKKLTNMRNLKDNLDSTTQWLADLSTTYLNKRDPTAPVTGDLSNIDDNKFEDLDRVKSELENHKASLLKNLSSDPEAKDQLDKLISKIDITIQDLEKKAIGHKELQTSLNGFNTEYGRLSGYVRAKLAKLDGINVITGQFEVSDKKWETNGLQVPQIQEIKGCIQQVEALIKEAMDVEEPKIETYLKAALSESKYRFWPEILSNEKLKSYQENLEELEGRFKYLNERGLIRVNELETVRDYSVKYAQLKTVFESYLVKTEGDVLKFEPIGIDKNVVDEQTATLHKMINEYEAKSLEMNELSVFTGTYVSLVGRLANQRQQEKTGGSLMNKLYKQINNVTNTNNSR